MGAVARYPADWDQEIREGHLHLILNGVGIKRNRGGRREEEAATTRLRIGYSNVNEKASNWML